MGHTFSSTIRKQSNNAYPYYLPRRNIQFICKFIEDWTKLEKAREQCKRIEEDMFPTYWWSYIDFIIKFKILIVQMQPQSPISSFKLNQEPQSPPVPQILRSRHKTNLQGDPRRLKEFTLYPKQIIIDAIKYNQQYPSNKDKRSFNHEGIRSQIDACLNAVSKVYGEQSKHKNNTTLKELKDYTNEPVFNKNSIHRVDAHLILKYIGTIDQQYGLQNRMRKLDIISETRNKANRHHAKNPQQRFTSVEKARGQSKRSFINLTVSNKKEKRMDSPIKPKFNASNHALSTNNSPYRTFNMTTPHHISSSTGKIKGKIEEEFKYCINCQQSILTSNIDYHETHQCKQLQNIYKLSFNDLRQFITQKINKFRVEIQQKIHHLRSIQSKHEKEFPKIDLKDQICENVLKSIEQYLQSEPINTVDPYKTFKSALKNEFFSCIALTQKLNYFKKILTNLSQHSQPNTNSHQPISKNKIDVEPQKMAQECKIVINGVSQFDPSD